MDLGIEDLRVLVTAGAGGIGLEIARAFVREGARVHVCDVDGAALAALASSDPALGRTRADVADRRQVETLFAEALAHLGGLDVLVNNAGIAGPTGRVEEIDPEDWDRCLEVCLTGQFNCARLAVPHLRASASGKSACDGDARELAEPHPRASANASMVNISSAAGKHGFALRAPYAAAKWAVIGFTKSLAIELGEAGVRVNAILPGLVAGDRQRRVLEAKAQQRGIPFAEMERLAFSATSLKDYVTPQQIADQVVFLCSPRARTITGQAIAVDGDTRMLS